jgi:hypothetical protein
MDFPFHEVYALADYYSSTKSAVFFGMYRYGDLRLWETHEGKARIFWTGQDALNWDFNDPHKPSILTGNVTAHPKVHARLTSNNRECKLVKPAAFQNERNPKPLGKKIYAYCPSSAPDYHGKEIINELRRGGYEIVIGDGQFSRQHWKTSSGDFHYNQCFIGLCLSEFAGGGESIIEMGLRGMRVVTNVFNLPNCDAWNSIHDVMAAIEDQTKYIGQTNTKLSQLVWRDLDHKHEWLNI